MDDPRDQLEARLRAPAPERGLPPASVVRQRGSVLRLRRRRGKLVGAGVVLCGALIVPLLIVNQRDPDDSNIETVAPDTSTTTPSGFTDGSAAQCNGDLPVTIDINHGFNVKVVKEPSIERGITTASWQTPDGVVIDARWPATDGAGASNRRIAGRAASIPDVDGPVPLNLVDLTDEQVDGPCATISFSAKANQRSVLDQSWPTLLDNLSGTFRVIPASGPIGSHFTVVGAPSRASLMSTITPALQQGRPIDVFWWNDGAFTGAEAEAEINAVIGAATLDERAWLRFDGIVPAQLNRNRAADGRDGTVDTKTGSYSIGFGHRLDRQPGATFNVTAAVSALEWRTIASPLGRRVNPTTLWTGTELMIWGGDNGSGSNVQLSGALFNPAGDTWRSMASSPIRSSPVSAVWAKDRAVFASGEMVAIYNPTTNQWATGTTGIRGKNAPLLVYTGTTVLAWFFEVGQGGAAYRIDPATGSLGTTSLPQPPHAVGYNSTQLWTGSEWMIFPAGESRIAMAFDPATSRWRELPASDIDFIRRLFVWTGIDVIAYGRDSTRRDFVARVAITPKTDLWRPLPDILVPTAIIKDEDEYSNVAPRLAWAGRLVYFLTSSDDPARALYADDPYSGTVQRLPALPSRAENGSPLVWTGRDVIVLLKSGQLAAIRVT